jgi:hypothetical protein
VVLKRQTRDSKRVLLHGPGPEKYLHSSFSSLSSLSSQLLSLNESHSWLTYRKVFETLSHFDTLIAMGESPRMHPRFPKNRVTRSKRAAIEALRLTKALALCHLNAQDPEHGKFASFILCQFEVEKKGKGSKYRLHSLRTLLAW